MPGSGASLPLAPELFKPTSPVHGARNVYTMGMLMDPVLGRTIERWRDGDRDAFQEVVDRYGLQVLRTARLILRDEALAEDATQETFLKAWRQIGTLRDEEPGPWLNRIAANEAISTYRRRHRFQALTERFGRFGGGKREVSSEARIDLARALDQLKPEQRAAVVLHYYQDLSVEDAAKALGIPVDTMKSRLKTALRRLRELTGTEEEIG
jgi:RNA polymerase sigma-70 factor (ECF subfamily)